MFVLCWQSLFIPEWRQSCCSFATSSLEEFMSGMQDADQMKEFEEIMKGYHDLVDYGRREIDNIEL